MTIRKPRTPKPRTPRRPALRRPTLRTQVLAGVLTITLAALTLFDVIAVSALHRYLVGQADARLWTALTVTQAKVPALIGGTAAAPIATTMAIPGAYDIAFVPAGAWTRPIMLEYAPGGAVTLASPRAKGYNTRAKGHDGAKAAQVALARDWHAQLSAAKTIAMPAGVLIGGASLTDVNATVSRFRLIVVAGSAAAGLLIFGVVVLVMRRGLRPLEAMAAQADRIDDAGQTGGTGRVQLGQADARSEVGRLGAALNGMLARIEAAAAEREASQELMRRFFADASHELRNPLASLRANAELCQQGVLRQGRQVDEAMRRIAVEAQRMSRLVDDMLGLARLDQHPAAEREPVNVTELVTDCVANARAADPHRTWQARPGRGLTVTADAELLRRAIDNLLANVRTHTPAGTVATVTASRAGAGVTIEVSDDGPGVPADQLPRIFDRFYRGDAPADRPGSGLGLAIVAEVASVHGGSATAGSATAGSATAGTATAGSATTGSRAPHGLCITITLPALANAGGRRGKDGGQPGQRQATVAVATRAWEPGSYQP
jgi:two-component system, OmpR family, sensor kinase